MLKKFQNTLNGVVIASEFSHVFCCVLPTAFSIFSLLIGAGVVSSMPVGLESLHDVMHGYELYIIAFSGLILALGWMVDVISRRVDCHDTGCGHGPCRPKKKRAHVVLQIATVLFAVNIAIYFGLHHNGGLITLPVEATETALEDHDH
jgi:hypothetical protein